MALKTAFGCATLRTGTLIVGWVNLMGTIIQFLNCLAIAVNREKLYPDLHRSLRERDQDGIRSEEILIFLFMAFSIFSIYGSLLYGTYMKRRNFLIPYIILDIIASVLAVVAVLYRYIVINTSAVMVLGMILAVVYNLCCLCIVWNYYEELKSEPGLDDSKNCPA